MNLRSISGICALGFIAVLAAGGAPSLRLRIVGSDLLGASFATAFEQHAIEKGYALEHAFHGSRVGFEAVKAGTADAALVMFAPGEELPGEGYVAEPLAYRIAVVAAPATIDLLEISFEQLDGFFGADGGAGYSLWKDLGVSGSAAPLSVSTHIWTDSNAAFSVDLFSRLALRTQQLKSSVVRHEKLESLLSRMRLEEGGLAILPQLPLKSAGMRVLAVAKKKGEPAFGPTPENIHNGDYPLSWPLFLVYRRAQQDRLGPLRAFLENDATTKTLAEELAFTPVPANARAPLK